jgi:hypothetical protein
MSRYIDADEVIKILPNDLPYKASVKRVLMQAPAADVVEVVRCGQCKHCTLTDEGEYNPEDIVCVYFMTDGMQETDYCSYGERREG